MIVSSSQNASASVGQLGDLIYCGAICQALRVATELRIPDLLAARPMPPHELAELTGSHPASLKRLLRMLSTVSFCREREDGKIELAELGKVLRTGTAQTLRSWLLWFTCYQWPLWANLGHSIQTGTSARKLATGTGGFKHLERDPEAAAIFNGAMSELSTLVAAEVVRICDFSDCRRIADIGGGQGALLLEILKSYSEMRGTLFDRPHALKGLQSILDQDILARCSLIPGDFFQSIPVSADICLLKNIIHDWDDDHSLAILRNCRPVLSDRGRLILIERIMPQRILPTARDRAIVWADLAMLVGPGGRERTEDEFRSLLSSAGYKTIRVSETGLEYSVIEAVLN
jgi:hypothetical protein